jgi:phosphoribosylformylglycinamidine synthase
LAVAEGARKVACTGAVPVAATNCLNFGNPEKPEIMAQLSAAIDGIAEACTALGTPITGGNVSLYNETKGEGIYPTPVIGVVGILDDVTKAVPADFQRTGDAIMLLSAGFWYDDQTREIGSTEFAKVVLGRLWGEPTPIQLKEEVKLQSLLRELADKGLLISARDISDGGIAVALAEATFRKAIGCRIALPEHLRGMSDLYPLFSEAPTRVLLSCAPTAVKTISNLAKEAGFRDCDEIGVTTAEKIEISVKDRVVISSNIQDLRSSWSNALQSTLSIDTVTA